MTSPLQSLEPAHLWQHFDAIRQVPRPSKHEEKISKHVKEWAKSRGFEVRVDAAGSMVIAVPATAGHERAPVVILQGHLDMVCEKNSDVTHDFMTDPIQVRVDGDWVKSIGTTLGADNGIGLAAAMAIADDPATVHGPLEILCTIDEETGLTGAKRLDPSLVNGRIMLNLDTEEDGAVYIGCAGGADTSARFPATRRRALLGSVPVQVVVRGLRGGHSGLNIIENRANAIKLATRAVIAALDQGIDVDLVSIDGGSKHNAIPRECFAVCRVLEADLAGFRAAVASATEDFQGEFGAAEPDMEVAVEAVQETDATQMPVNVHARDRLLGSLNGLPHGVLSMSREVPGLVETSTNLAVVSTEVDGVHLVQSHRSSVMPALFAVRRAVASSLALAGASYEWDEPYPGWAPNPSSAIVAKTVDVYERLFGSKPAIKAIHAGLECGLLLEKVPGMDAVSIGPEIHNAHSPDEMVQISSVQKFYRHLAALLADLA